MPLYFLTGNKNKFAEVKAILPDVEQLDIDLPEIQDLDAREIIKAKLAEAFKHKDAEFIVEDHSFYLDCLNGLPGPFIKWFLKTIGNDGLLSIAQKIGNTKARATVMIGYAKNSEEVHFFEGHIDGQLVPPVGEEGFGWDPIFQPDGGSRTYAQLTAEEKNEISMRRVAVNKLKEFLAVL